MDNRLDAGIDRRSVVAGAVAALAAPRILRAQETPKSGTVRIGMQSILSGPVALVGTSQQNAAQIEVERINANGGLAGRKIELVIRDSKGQPQEAARVARELVNSSGCELLMDAEGSSGAFAVQEVVRDLGVFCIHTATETSALTADPKLRAPTAFRCARQGIHDGIVGARYSTTVANEKKFTRWATCAPDYSYGHDTTTQFFEFFKKFKPDVEVVTQAWPKLGTPDFTEVITKLLQAKPQALYSLQYAGDLSSFINQGNVYALFGSVVMFNPEPGRLPGADLGEEPADRHAGWKPLPGEFPGPAGQQGVGRNLPQAFRPISDRLVLAKRRRVDVSGGGGQESRQPGYQEACRGHGGPDHRLSVR